MIRLVLDLLTLLSAFFLACVLHEVGHAVVAWFFEIKIKDYGWKGFYGVWIRRSRHPVLWKEIAISSAGVITNLLVWWWAIGPDVTLARFSFVLALVNLVPVTGSDGYRILKELRK